MPQRRSRSRQRRPLSSRSYKDLAGPVILALCLLFVAWRIVVETTSATLAAGGDAAGAVYWSENAAALASLAEERLVDAATREDIAAAADFARRALIANPLEEKALTQIGLASDLAGDEERANRIMQLANGRSLRAPGVQAWLLNRAIAAKDYAAAMEHADALMRVQPRMVANLGGAFAAFASDPKMRAPLIELLARNPPWRGDILARMGSDARNSATTFALFTELSKTATPPTAAETAPLISALIKAGQFDFAYLAWMHFLPTDQRARIDYVFNGNFEYPISGVPFDWITNQVRGSTVEVADAPEADAGKMLHLVFAPMRLREAPVAKLLMLNPGRYRLTGMARAAALDSERGLSWRLSCAKEKGPRLAEGTGLKGTFPWTKFSIEFDVPADCRAQWLKLELLARAELERAIGGEVWFDRVAVERIAAPDVTSN